MLVSRTGGPTAAAGGGGAGTAAADTNSNIVQTIPGNANGRGGDGILNSILGTPYYWGGGGGGGAYFNGYAGNGGLGGGGGGSCSGGIGPTSGGGSALNSGSGAAINANGGAGGTNTGGGGGGGAWQVTSGGAGGSGIVIVRYQGPQKAIGGTITSNNGYTIHTFTTVGSTTFTPLVATNNSAILGLSDLSGRGNFGTTVNSPTYSSANGGSIVFDGVDDLVNLGSTNNLTGNNLQTLTASVWLKYSTTTSDLRAFNLSRGSGTNSTLFAIYCNTVILSGTNTSSIGALGFFARRFDDTAHTSLTHNDNYHLKNRFINVSCVIDGTNRFLYIDGILRNSDSGVGMQSVSNNTDIAYVGTGPGGSGNVPWNGNISNVLFYRRALTAAEIQQNFNALRSRFSI
jgi:hypothetical protein